MKKMITICFGLILLFLSIQLSAQGKQEAVNWFLKYLLPLDMVSMK